MAISKYLRYADMICLEGSVTREIALIALHAAMCGVEFRQDQLQASVWTRRLRDAMDGWLEAAASADSEESQGGILTATVTATPLNSGDTQRTAMNATR